MGMHLYKIVFQMLQRNVYIEAKSKVRNNSTKIRYDSWFTGKINTQIIRRISENSNFNSLIILKLVIVNI